MTTVGDIRSRVDGWTAVVRRQCVSIGAEPSAFQGTIHLDQGEGTLRRRDCILVTTQVSVHLRAQFTRHR